MASLPATATATTTGLSRWRWGQLRFPAGQRVLLLGLAGLLLTLSVAGTAWMCLTQVTEANQRLALVNRAQRHHQNADMMHDALRADVARAQQLPGLWGDPRARALRVDTVLHARTFREDVAALVALRLPPAVGAAMEDLRPTQSAYIGHAQDAVGAALRGRPDAAAAQRRAEDAYAALAEPQSEATRLLAGVAVRAETLAATEKRLALRRLVLASLLAFAGWSALLLWQQRSVGRLHGALLREAQQRSAADLLQRSLLPATLPQVPGVDLSACSLPGQDGCRVGGDWYDVIPLPSGEVGLVVGDVLGHDLSAATAMGQLRNALRAYALDDASPARVLSRVNRAVDLLDVVDLATCMYAVLDPRTLSVRWASAGHLPLLVLSPEGGGRLVPVDPGPPLGALACADYVDHDLRLRPGDALALYTDGLVERRGACIEAGLSRLTALRGPYADAEQMCDHTVRALLGEQPPGDDVTLLVLQTDTAVPGAGRVA